LDRDEVLEVIEMPLTEAMRMIETGAIRDAKSIVGLQAVYLRSAPSRKNEQGASRSKQETP
jgi:ADP-ribose diphosphatase